MSTSSGLFYEECLVRFILSFAFPSPASLWFFHRKPFVLSKQALICTSSSALHQGCQVSILTPAWTAVQVVLSSGQWLCVQFSCLMGPARLGRKPQSQMFALLPGSPKSSCLLIDDNLHNDTECSVAARHERDPASSPVQALAGWPNPYLSACRQQRRQEPEGTWSKDAHYNPDGFNTWRERGSSLMLSACKVTKKSTHRGSTQTWCLYIGISV